MISVNLTSLTKAQAKILKCFAVLTLTIFVPKAYAVQSNFFRETISDYAAFEQSIEQNKKQAIDQAKSKSEGIPEMSNTDREIERLNNLNVHDLKSEGMKVRAAEENKYLNDIDIDYSQPGKQAIYKDAEAIANASGKLLENLQNDLSSLGFNCNETAGNRSIDNPYKLEIIREKEKVLVYEQKFCEQPVNKYECTNTLKLSCAQPGRLTPKISLSSVKTYFDNSFDGFQVGGQVQNTREFAVIAFDYHVKIRDYYAGHASIDTSYNLDSIDRLEIKNFKIENEDHLAITGATSIQGFVNGYAFPLISCGEKKLVGVVIEEKVYEFLIPKNLLRAGINTISFTLKLNNHYATVGPIPEGFYNLKSYFEVYAYGAPSCDNWKETWEEICVPK